MSDSVQSDPIQRSHEDAIRLLVDGESSWDKRLIRLSYWLNPILVKETRQALKSKQFLWTFMLLIVFTIAWTVLAVLLSIPNVYYDSDGSVFLSGYLIILLVPTIIVIPQAAFRSMSAELEDGTFETLSLSMLTPRQVVYGKLSVSSLQLIVYLSILAPCIALTYLLRGVTLEIIVALLLVISIVCLFLSATSIFLAAASRTRTIQVLFSVSMLVLQLITVGCLLTTITYQISQQSLEVDGWMVLVLVCGVFMAYAWLWLRCAASMIDMASANRSTPVRFAVFVVGMVISMGGIMCMMNHEDYFANDGERSAMVRFLAGCCWVHWGVAGAWMMGESGIITQRARRSLPDSYFGRIFFTWFNPGSGPAYLLVVLGFLGPWLGYFLATDLLWIGLGRYGSLPTVAYGTWLFVLALAAYLAFYLGIVRLVLLVIYRKTRASRILTSFAMTVALIIVSVFATISINLVMNSYRGMEYDWYCFINPIWTLGEMSPHFYNQDLGSLFSGSDPLIAWVALMLTASLLFVTNAVLTARDMMVSRVEIPPRVLAEHPEKKQIEEMDPWKE